MHSRWIELSSWLFVTRLYTTDEVMDDSVPRALDAVDFVSRLAEWAAGSTPDYSGLAEYAFGGLREYRDILRVKPLEKMNEWLESQRVNWSNIAADRGQWIVELEKAREWFRTRIEILESLVAAKDRRIEELERQLAGSFHAVSAEES
jgi:hypothetical protein